MTLAVGFLFPARADTNAVAGKFSDSGEPIFPLVEMDHVPLTMAIERLSRMADINCMLDARLTQRWTDATEPIVNFHLRNVSAKEVLRQMLALRHLALLENPASNIAIITRADQSMNDFVVRLPSIPVSDTNEIIPLIEFGDVPITSAIEHLARQAGINYLLDAELGPMLTGSAEPTINFRLKNVTAMATLERLLCAHRLALLKDSAANIAIITRTGQTTNGLFAHLPSVPVCRTNEIIPLIQFSDVPLSTAIEHLARQAEINFMIDPRSVPMLAGSAEPMLSVRLEDVTAQAVLERLLNTYRLILAEDHVTGVATVTRYDQPLPAAVDVGLLGIDTNNPVLSTNDIIPLIQFSHVPLDLALAHLIWQTGAKLQLDPRLVGTDATWELNRTNHNALIYGNADRTKLDKWFDPMPLVSVRWESVTARQAIVALCVNYDFVIIKDEASDVLQIKPREIKKHHRLQLR